MFKKIGILVMSLCLLAACSEADALADRNLVELDAENE